MSSQYEGSEKMDIDESATTAATSSAAQSSTACSVVAGKQFTSGTTAGTSTHLSTAQTGRTNAYSANSMDGAYNAEGHIIPAGDGESDAEAEAELNAHLKNFKSNQAMRRTESSLATLGLEGSSKSSNVRLRKRDS